MTVCYRFADGEGSAIQGGTGGKAVDPALPRPDAAGRGPGADRRVRPADAADGCDDVAPRQRMAARDPVRGPAGRGAGRAEPNRALRRGRPCRDASHRARRRRRPPPAGQPHRARRNRHRPGRSGPERPRRARPRPRRRPAGPARLLRRRPPPPRRLRRHRRAAHRAEARTEGAARRGPPGGDRVQRGASGRGTPDARERETHGPRRHRLEAGRRTLRIGRNQGLERDPRETRHPQAVRRQPGGERRRAAARHRRRFFRPPRLSRGAEIGAAARSSASPIT